MPSVVNRDAWDKPSSASHRWCKAGVRTSIFVAPGTNCITELRVHTLTLPCNTLVTFSCTCTTLYCHHNVCWRNRIAKCPISTPTPAGYRQKGSLHKQRHQLSGRTSAGCGSGSSSQSRIDDICLDCFLDCWLEDASSGSLFQSRTDATLPSTACIT